MAPSPRPSQSTAPDLAIETLSRAQIDALRGSPLVQANNRFAWRLFDSVYKDSPDTNQFMSPISGIIALHMVLQGAEGETRRQILASLGISSISESSLKTQISQLLLKLRQPSEDIQLEVVNGFWANHHYSFQPSFTAELSKNFNAMVASLNFSQLETYSRINQWVRQASHNKLKQLIEEPPGPAELSRLQANIAYLINVIYFNAKWTEAFDPSETSYKPFKTANGTIRMVPMMRSFSELPYLMPGDAFPHQGIALPYGKGGKIRMYLFLPTIGKTLDDLERDLLASDFDALSRKFTLEGGSLEMPRFKLEWRRSLVDDLKRLGITDAFDSHQADFSRMLSPTPKGGSCYISDFEQLTYLDVNEAGTEAAALSVVTYSSPSSIPQRTHSMIIDQPFLFLIQDEETGQILFMGAIKDPET